MSFPIRGAVSASTLLALLLIAPTGPIRGQGRAGDRIDPAWLSRLDPHLRRIAIGTTRGEGRFRAPVAARSRDVLRTLSRRIQADAAGPEATIRIRARFAHAALSPEGLRAPVARALEEIGAGVRGRVDDIVSLSVPVSSLERLAGHPSVVWLKAAHTYHLLNDVSTAAAQVASDEVNAGLGVDGSGVIVAVVDTGIDWTNPDFRNADGTTRILGIWDQTLTDPGHGPPAGFSFGAHYTRADIDAALSSGGSLMTGDGHGHGTHVAGTAAGNGRHTGQGVPAGTFAGVAPAADLLIVRVFDDAGAFCLDCDLTAGVQFVRQTAAAEGKPWVGNMSLGTDIGAHDGSDPDEIAIANAVGPGRRGAQMAIAAGNSGSRSMHWTGALVQGGSSSNGFTVSSYTPEPGAENDVIWIDFWYPGSASAEFRITTPDGVTVSAARGNDSGIVCTADGAIIVDATNAPDPANGDNEVFVQIWDDSGCDPVAPPGAGAWTIEVAADAVAPGEDTFHLWNEATMPPFYAPLSSFTLDNTVAVPGTARHAMAAASYVGKDRWINSSGSQTCCPRSAAVGAKSSFSGIGPARDGRLKPDLAAPGEWVGSTLAGGIGASRGTFFTERDGVHGDIRGTSMATPHVAGAAALVLSINPDLTGPEVKAALVEGARGDSFTGAVPNTRYGHGKLRADDGAMQAAAVVVDLSASGGGSFAATSSPFVDGYNVYRAAIPGLSSSNYGACFLQGLPTASFTDPDPPPPGTAFAYLAVGTFGGVEGILGVDGAGNIRPNNFPCP